MPKYQVIYSSLAEKHGIYVNKEIIVDAHTAQDAQFQVELDIRHEKTARVKKVRPFMDRNEFIKIDDLPGLKSVAFSQDEAKESCRSCKFFEDTGEGVKDKCRRFPENCITWSSDWCGEYKRSDEERCQSCQSCKFFEKTINEFEKNRCRNGPLVVDIQPDDSCKDYQNA